MYLRVALLAALVCVCVGQTAFPGQLGPGAVGESVFSWTFHAENSTDGWAGAGDRGTIGVANIVEGGYLGQKALLVQNLATTRATKVVTHDIPKSDLARYTTVRVSARAKAVNVASSSVSWDGVKVSLKTTSYVNDQPVSTYPQKTKIWGTFDWNTTIVNDVQISDVSSIQIIIGLGNTTGTVFFDSINVTIIASVPAITSADLANFVFSCSTFLDQYCNLDSGVPKGKTIPNGFQIKVSPNGQPADCGVAYTPSQTSATCFDVDYTRFSGTYTIYARLSPSSPWVATKTVLNYERPPHPDYVGCFPDSVTNRDLPFQGPNVPNQMYDKCQEWCGSRGYEYAGLQSASECWCGHTYGQRGAKVPDTQCDQPCVDDTRYLCGGALKNSVYRSFGRELYVGCYADSTINRDLPVQVFPAGGVTPISCSQTCGRPFDPSSGLPKYRYAGLQNGVQCFCGNSYGNNPNPAQESDCNKPCVSDPTSICGGANRNSIWESSWNSEPYEAP